MESEILPAEVIGVSSPAVGMREFVSAAERNSAPVLLVGESGTGKQLTARVIHENASRKKEPLLMIDCCLYYERELKRELFGYGGAGAVGKERKGVLEFASKGTCYLAHIEELTPSIQENLLSFLKKGRFRRLGDGKEISSDARVIVSSDKNLDGFVRAGLFLEDLYREFVQQAHFLSPLRERKEDIPLLVESLVKACVGKSPLRASPRFLPDAMDALKCYPWPANFDELLGEAKRLLDSGVSEIRIQHLAMEISSYWLGQRGDPETRKVLEELDGYIREYRILSRLGCEFGDPTHEDGYFSLACFEPERDILEDYEV